ncbi:MAG: hypothetical protein PHV61_00395 [Limnochordia bacterium]|jgi:hypothetical protein|nr:hypothetical protein [Limnochordia bacterium]MDD2628619.1 hypothetical protein [Limnochordia bacterium]MDD4518126.1 hypothetical protein [Limnochordia bacterium]
MKRTLLFLIGLALVLGVTVIASAEEVTQRWDFAVEVMPYIMAAESPVNGYGYGEYQLYGPGFAWGYIGFHTNWRNAAYANTPVSVTILGNNAAGDNSPVFARLQQGSRAGEGRYDRLDTWWLVMVRVNEVQKDYNAWAGKLGANGFQVENFEGFLEWEDPVPHNGEINVAAFVHVDGPDATATGQNPYPFNTKRWWQSADAGIYECYLTFVYAPSLD